MEISELSRKIITLGVTAALSSGATYWYFSSQFDEERLTLQDKIRALEENERNAIVTKRISEQMGDIADQQKTIADSARQKAEFESHKAMEQAQRAEDERRNALIAKDKADKAEVEARNQAAQAERERAAAQQARDVADLARAKADTMRYISLGHSLAQTSLTQFNAGHEDLARLLAFSGYKYTTEYGGNPYQQDVFTSLLCNAYNARNKITQFVGGVRDISCLNEDKCAEGQDADMVAVTDYGEISLLTPKPREDGRWTGFNSTKLFNNSNYIFTDMLVVDSTVYALDVTGRLIKLNAYKGANQTPVIINVASSTRASERWNRLQYKQNGDLIAIGQHQVSWVKKNTGEIYRQKYIEETITRAGIGDGKLIAFTKEGKHYVFHEGEPISWSMDLPTGNYVTCYYYHKAKHLHAVGLDNGNIIFFDNSGKRVSEFTGHTGPITNMKQDGWCFITSSYDKTLRIWNLDDIGGLVVPLEMKCNSWPLTLEMDRNVNAIRVGYASGEIESIRISVNDNAASVRKEIRREFTEEEWNYYIGKDEPYRTFIEK